MAKHYSQMTANEYRDWLLNNPEEVKKLDEATPPTGSAISGTWRNGQWVAAVPVSPEKPQ
jgi:hypothetical protein